MLKGVGKGCNDLSQVYVRVRSGRTKGKQGKNIKVGGGGRCLFFFLLLFWHILEGRQKKNGIPAF